MKSPFSSTASPAPYKQRQVTLHLLEMQMLLNVIAPPNPPPPPTPPQKKKIVFSYGVANRAASLNNRESVAKFWV